MSFRARLTLFFVLIVIVPMVAVALVLFRLISDSETGKADAGVAARQRAAITLYAQARDEAARAMRRVGSDRVLATALRTSDAAAAARRAGQLLDGGVIERIVVMRSGRRVVDVGSQTAVAPSMTTLLDAGRRPFGRLEVSVTGAGEYVAQARRLTGAQIVVRAGSRTLGSTLGGAGAVSAPVPGRATDASVGGRRYRAASFDVTGFEGRRLRIAVLADNGRRASAITDKRLLAAAILFGFLVLALTFAITVSKSLQTQVGTLLAAARRLAGGDFSTDVPTRGGDEFAELGAEFNEMAHQLEARLEELRRERARVAASLQRIGQTFASNLDSDALMKIVLGTAVDGLDGEAGRASARAKSGRLEEWARSGPLEAMQGAVLAAETEALRLGRGHDVSVGDAHAIAQPLRGVEDGGRVLGVLTVARPRRPFGDAERELLAYLAGTAAVSIENVGLHETVQRQAVIDELTGLFNHRRFQEALASEVERAKRFDQSLGLVMIDIDDFKAVNDTFGHQQGDRVLREVARVVRDSSREIDSPARYGGEELAVILPGAEVDGAFRLAERVRAAIEALVLELPDGTGSVHVTASFGVAALPEIASDAPALIAAADAALYVAKRSGRNRTIRAGVAGSII